MNHHTPPNVKNEIPDVENTDMTQEQEEGGILTSLSSLRESIRVLVLALLMSLAPACGLTKQQQEGINGGEAVLAEEEKKKESLIEEYQKCEKDKLSTREFLTRITVQIGDVAKIERNEVAGMFIKELRRLEEKQMEIGNKLRRFYQENYAYVGSYSEGRAAVKDKEWNQFHIDLYGKRVYKENYAYVGDYSEGRAWVEDKGGNELYIDLNGNRIKE